MFDGYLSLGGTELINSARTEAYIRHNAATMPFRNCLECGDLAAVLAEPEYESPIVDDAPWFDPSIPATGRFWGLYPLSIEGMENSTRSASVTESIVDGGFVGTVRHGTRAIRVHGLLLAADENAMSAGTTWLRNALDPAPCSAHGGSCGGAQLCYYAACPAICAMYEPTYSVGNVIPILNESVSTSPVVFRHSLFTSTMWKAELIPSAGSLEGTIIRWTAGQGGAVEDERHGPVVLQRTNYIVNGGFNTNIANWTSSGGGTTTWTSVGSGYGELPYGSGGYGTGTGSIDYLRRTGGTTNGSSTVITRSANMTAYSGGVIISANIWRDAADATPYVQVRLKSSVDNAVISQATFSVTDEIRTYSFTAPTAGPSYLEFATGGPVNIDSVMLEAGSTPLPFFDGYTPAGIAMANYITGEIENEYTVSWLGVEDASASRIVWNGRIVWGAPMGDFDESVAGLCDSLPVLNIIQGVVSGDLVTYSRLAVSVADQSLQYERTMHDVTCVEGPTVIGERKFEDGSVMREVDFLLIAGRPAAYGPTRTVLGPIRMVELDTNPWTDQDCTVPEASPIIDPDCPPVPAPPRPPMIPNSCVTEETLWQRYWLDIPADYISAWSGTSPQVTITSGTNEIRQVRVRAYPNPFDREPSDAKLHNTTINPKLADNAGDWGRLGGIGTNNGRIAAGDGPPIGINTYQRVTATGTHGPDTFGVSNSFDLNNTVVAGEDFRVAIWGRVNVARNMQLRIGYVNAAGTEFAVGFFDGKGVLGNVWNRFDTGVQTAPANTVRLSVAVTGASTTWSVGNVVEATALIVETGTAELRGIYFDGDTEGFGGFYYGWTGVQNDSVTDAFTSPVDPCSWCSEFVVSYLPANTELTVDAILERAFASVAGGDAVSANHLLYAGDGSPMTWPELSCGQGYLFAIDVPEPLLDDVTVTVTLTTKE